MQRLRNTLVLWIVKFGLVLTASVITNFLQDHNVLPDAELTQEFKKLIRNPYFAFGIGVLTIPVVEEGVFRGWLRSPRWALGVVALSIVYAGIGFVEAITAYEVIDGLVYLGYFVFWMIAEALIEHNWNPRLDAYLMPTYSRFFPGFFYVSVVLFGLAHASNYELTSLPIWAYPVITAPQLIAGCFLGYTRVRYGFWHAVLLHTVHNGVCFLPAFVAS